MTQVNLREITIKVILLQTEGYVLGMNQHSVTEPQLALPKTNVFME